jgi:hypothetical protein
MKIKAGQGWCIENLPETHVFVVFIVFGVVDWTLSDEPAHP